MEIAKHQLHPEEFHKIDVALEDVDLGPGCSPLPLSPSCEDSSPDASLVSSLGASGGGGGGLSGAVEHS